jgi:transcriptional regulator GlxA family with amidase domain
VQVDPSVLYVDCGRVLTGAGTAAGVDTLLHLVRREWGAAAANALARDMVVPPHRDGGQAQFIDSPVARCEDDLLGVVLEWARAHLAEEISVESMARRALMSPRSFARRFKATTGTTPHAWLLGQRLAAAEGLLEGSDAPVEEIARLVGFGTAAGLREQFTRRRGVSPRAYRQTFRAAASAGTAPVQLHRHWPGAGGVRGDQTGVEAGLGQPA